jgi:hydrogenase assembly chaperone HypC/HupF
MGNQSQEHRPTLRDEPLAIDRLYCDGEGVCLTCSDEALPARVLSVGEEAGLALVALGGTIMEVDVTLVEAVVPGDWLLVHGGVALGRVGEEQEP